jgi:hypothetical protein
MDLLKTILGANDGGNVRQLAGKFGLQENQARSAVEQLLPSLAQGFKNNMGKPGGMEALLGALQKGNHQRFLDDPAELDRDETTSEGNGILGHLFGSKEVSRNVAARASAESGVDGGILKKMLPLVATMVMGGMSKQTQGGTKQDMGLLGSLLDSDGDGSVADDLMNMAKKFF